MAGPGWAKEGNWHDHEPHTSHGTGPTPEEVDEVMEEMSRHDGGTSLDAFFISTGVNGALNRNALAEARVKELWGVEPTVDRSEALLASYSAMGTAAANGSAAAMQLAAAVAGFNGEVRSGRRAAIL